MSFEFDSCDFETITEAFERLRIAIAENSTVPGREPVLALAADANLELTEMFDNFRELLNLCQQIPITYDNQEAIFNDINMLEQLVGAIGYHALRANLVLIYLVSLVDNKLSVENPMHPQHPDFYKVFGLFKRILANPILDREHRNLENFIAQNYSNLDKIDWSKI